MNEERLIHSSKNLFKSNILQWCKVNVFQQNITRNLKSEERWVHSSKNLLISDILQWCRVFLLNTGEDI